MGCNLSDLTKPYFARWLKSYIIDKKWKYFLCNLEVTSYSDSKFHHSNYNYSPLLRKLAPSIEDYAPLCLYYAALCGFYNLTQYLISKYPQHLNAGVGYNQSPLVAALFHQHFPVTDLLHRNGTAVEIMSLAAVTPLHAASKDRMIHVVWWLLEHGTVGNSRMQDGSTPLLLAIGKGCLEIIQTLLEHGVDVVTLSDYLFRLLYTDYHWDCIFPLSWSTHKALTLILVLLHRDPLYHCTIRSDSSIPCPCMITLWSLYDTTCY